MNTPAGPSADPAPADPAPTDLEARWKQRPRNRFLRISLALFGALLVFCWIESGASPSELFSSESAANLSRFWEEDVKPPALRGRDWDWGVFGAWAGQRMQETGWVAALATLAVSILAIVFAALASLPLSLLAARTFAAPEPFLPTGRRPGRFRRAGWLLLLWGTRVVLMLMRSMPEYVLAFLLLQILGRSAWPAVLALAIHNAGILGRLNAEVVENLPQGTLKALRGAGASRMQIAYVGLLPAALPRFLLYFFYRWETCVREATVLGMLGLVGLGYEIMEAGAHEQEDRLIFYVLLASAIVLLGDFISALARGIVRRA